uniref:THAP domain-containing protein 1-like n=1 Tax=Diabrotica virgifera virgifera TaxID=50390 RepID=A0A6P7G7P2_DIAVI
MPQCCVVPLCSSRTSGHRFPKDSLMRKKWIIAIRRDKYVPTINARICNKHFVKTDYVLPLDSNVKNPKPRLKKNVIPSQFSWTEKKRESAKQRKERMIKRALRKESSHLSSISSSNPVPPEPCDEVEVESTPIEINDHEDELIDKCDASTMTSTPLFAVILDIKSEYLVLDILPDGKSGPSISTSKVTMII